MINMEADFWKNKPLSAMSTEEWEALCDGCGLCCLVKLSDEDSDEILYTSIACSLLDLKTCRCSDYENRFQSEVNCIPIDHKTLENPELLPVTCAYRLLYEGSHLKVWHPLRSKDPKTVQEAGIQVSEFALSAKDFNFTKVEDYDEYVLAGMINHKND